MNNMRNEYGFKDQYNCHRKGGKFIQWMDEACDYDGKFWTYVSMCKALNIKYRLTTIEDGKRLFIENNRCNEL